MYGQQCEDNYTVEEVAEMRPGRAGELKESSVRKKIVESIFRKLETLKGMTTEVTMQTEQRNNMFLGLEPEREDDDIKFLPQGIFHEIELKVERLMRQTRKIIELNEKFSESY